MVFLYNPGMHNVVEAITFGFTEELGSHLEAVFLYGSLAQGTYFPEESDVNLLLVVADEPSMHAIRDIFLPIWEAHGERLRRGPAVARRGAFQRHLELNPVFAHHLANDAKLLHGDPSLLQPLPAFDPREAFAFIAFEAMQASAAVTADLLEPDIVATTTRRLRRLARRVTGAPVESDKPIGLLLGTIQDYLNSELASSPQLERWVSPKRPTTSLLLPSLESAYKELGQLVMSFSTLTSHQVENIDWGHLSQQLSKHYTGLKATTSTQFRLIVEFEAPLAYSFQRFEHEWGVKVLEDVPISRSRILRSAARVPSAILIDQFPDAYLTCREDQLGKLIHDFQNKMLNVQLEHELLRRLQKITRFEPPEPLPERSAPARKRIDAIFKHLDWWTGFYADQIGQDE